MGDRRGNSDGQNESDPLIEDLDAGSVVGPLVLGDDGNRVDCARLGKGGYSVPSIVASPSTTACC